MSASRGTFDDPADPDTTGDMTTDAADAREEPDAPYAAGLTPHEQAAMFRGIALGSPHGVVASDLAGRIIWANAVTEEMFGWPHGALLGRRFTVLLPDSVHDRVLSVRERVLAGERVRPFETTALRRDGGTFDISAAPAVLRDDDGRPVGVNIVLRDVTEDLRVQRELSAALDRSHARFDQSSMPQALLDLQGRFVDLNDAGCELLGRPREELVGLPSAEVIYPDDPARVLEQLRRLRDGRTQSSTYETVARRPDGRKVPLQVDISAVLDEHGDPHEFAAFARDLTELRAAQREMESQAAFFHALYRQSTDAAVVVDADGHLKYVSPAVSQLLGYDPDQVLDLLSFDFVHPEEVARVREQMATVLADPGRSERILVRIRDAEGSWRWFEDRLRNCVDDPDIGGVVVNLRDVTSEVEAQRALSASETRYRAIAETAQEGIIVISPHGDVLFANERLGSILGLDLRDVYALSGTDLFEPAGAEGVATRRDAPRPGDSGRYDVPYAHPDGEERTLYVATSALVADDGTPLGSLAMVSDVTAERAAENRLRRQALHDTLTGLPNRALFMDRLSTAAARHERSPGAGVAVLFLDLDHFKLVNDTHGHVVGDRLLAAVGERIAGAVRTTDTVARLGGDEFAVICEDTGPDDAAAVAGRIQEALGRPVDIEGDQLRMSVSIGVALAPPSSVPELLGDADTAMYRAKSRGRSQVVTFDVDLSEETDRRVAIGDALRSSLLTRSLELAYQPIVEIGTRRLLGLEAVLRWSHPTLGPVAPDELCRAADTAGVGYELDRAVLFTAAQELVRLRDSGVVPPGVFVSLGIGSRTAQYRRVERLVDEVLESTGLPAGCLSLEITEKALVSDVERADLMLEELNRRGVRVAVGDFGALYNSLFYLQRLPVNALKIDRSFVEALDTGAGGRGVARTIVEFAGAIGVRTVAEGIETEEQASALAGLGCEVGQGRLWGPASSADALAEVLAQLER